MFGKTVLKELNIQINLEMQSAYLYLAMSAYCEERNYSGCAAWLKAQAAEEMSHAMKMYDFVHERGGVVELDAMEKPESSFKSVLDVFEKTLAHEQKVTARIDHVYAEAVKENDYASQVFLQWFINEQVEEEANATKIVETLRMIGDSKNGLYMLDQQLGHRGQGGH